MLFNASEIDWDQTVFTLSCLFCTVFTHTHTLYTFHLRIHAVVGFPFLCCGKLVNSTMKYKLGTQMFMGKVFKLRLLVQEMRQCGSGLKGEAE